MKTILIRHTKIPNLRCMIITLFVYRKSSAQLIIGKNNRHRERTENAEIEDKESRVTVCTPATCSALNSYDVVSGKTLDDADIYRPKTKTDDSTKNSSPRSSISSSDDDTEVNEGIFPCMYV